MLVIFLFCYSNSADFRRSFGGSISITAQCIETQLMPNEGSGKDLQIMCWSLLRQISLSWCNLRHKVSTPVKLFLFILLLSFFLSFFLSPGHDLFTVSKQLAIRFQQNFTRILMGSVRIAVQNYIDLAVDLDLSRSQICKSTFWAISRFLPDKLSPNFNTG